MRKTCIFRNTLASFRQPASSPPERHREPALQDVMLVSPRGNG